MLNTLPSVDVAGTGADDVHAGGRFRGRDAMRLTVALLVMLAAATAILGADVVRSGVSLREGEIAQGQLRAPRALTFDSAIDTEAARQKARDAVPPQYDYTPQRGSAIAEEQLAAFARAVSPVTDAFTQPLSEETRRQALASVLPEVSPEARSTMLGLTAARWITIRDEAARVLGSLERAELRDTALAEERDALQIRMTGDLSLAERRLAAEIVSPLLVPNSSYSEVLTIEARDRAAEGVETVRRQVRQGEVIVEAGRPVGAREIEVIKALGLDVQQPDLARLAGWFLLALILGALMLAWMWRFRRELWHRSNALLLIGLVVIGALIAFKLTADRSILPFFVPAAAVGLLLAVLLDAGVAILATALLAILAGAINGSSLELATYVFLGGFAGIVVIRKGDRVQAFVRAGAAVALVGCAVVTTFSLLGERDLTGILQLWAASLAAGAGAAVAAAGSFAVLGNLFGITTVFQLLELGNPSQPLLRRLLVETPGTYHHSLMVGNLAERAAEAIGADPLITRVAAYYHDIGKLANPLAFIENQAGGTNIHDQLDPAVSAQVLRQHVADGIELAYRTRLPKPLIAFIPQHHGTALMSYFYARARERAAAPFGGIETAAGRTAADAVQQAVFRHAGPKPQSREAALIMLADGVEASVRSLSTHDEPAIRAMVERIIGERLADGQFDECDLTLRDLERIREGFIALLLGMYHRRIEYPQNKVVELESRREASGRG